MPSSLQGNEMLVTVAHDSSSFTNVHINDLGTSGCDNYFEVKVSEGACKFCFFMMEGCTKCSSETQCS